jgi:hypothetical protein
VVTLWKLANAQRANMDDLKDHRARVIAMRKSGKILERKLRKLMKLKGKTLPIRLKKEMNM